MPNILVSNHHIYLRQKRENLFALTLLYIKPYLTWIVKSAARLTRNIRNVWHLTQNYICFQCASSSLHLLPVFF